MRSLVSCGIAPAAAESLSTIESVAGDRSRCAARSLRLTGRCCPFLLNLLRDMTLAVSHRGLTGASISVNIILDAKFAKCYKIIQLLNRFSTPSKRITAANDHSCRIALLG